MSTNETLFLWFQLLNTWLPVCFTTTVSFFRCSTLEIQSWTHRPLYLALRNKDPMEYPLFSSSHTSWHYRVTSQCRDINTWVGIQSPGSAKCMPQDTTQEFKQKLWLKNLGTTQLSCCSDITWRMLQKSRVAKSTRNGCSNVGKVFCCLKKKKSFKENRARKSFLEKTATNWQEFCLTEFKIQPCSAYLLKGNVTKESSFCEIFQKTNLIDLSAVPYCSAVPIAKNMRIKY